MKKKISKKRKSGGPKYPTIYNDKYQEALLAISVWMAWKCYGVPILDLSIGQINIIGEVIDTASCMQAKGKDKTLS